MATIYWAHLLHFYQPPIQIPEVLRKVVDESYRPLIDVFEQYPHAKRHREHQRRPHRDALRERLQDVIDGLRELARARPGRVRRLRQVPRHPAAHHRSRSSAARSGAITSPTATSSATSTSPQGFFPPEMCYDRTILEPIIDVGHEWVIMSGVACPAPLADERGLSDASRSMVHDIAVVFRDDVLSNKISFQDIDGKALRRAPARGARRRPRHVHRHGDGRRDLRPPHRELGPALPRRGLRGRRRRYDERRPSRARSPRARARCSP